MAVDRANSDVRWVSTRLLQPLQRYKSLALLAFDISDELEKE